MRTVLLSVYLVMSLFAIAPAQQEKDLILHPYFAGLVVANLDSSIQWYSDHLNLHLVNRTDRADLGLRQANLRSFTMLIELVELQSTVSPDKALVGLPKGSRVTGYYKFGMVLEDFDDYLAHLESLGTAIHGRVVQDPVSGKRTFLIKDPDGNLLQFFDR